MRKDLKCPGWLGLGDGYIYRQVGEEITYSTVVYQTPCNRWQSFKFKHLRWLEKIFPVKCVEYARYENVKIDAVGFDLDTRGLTMTVTMTGKLVEYEGENNEIHN